MSDGIYIHCTHLIPVDFAQRPNVLLSVGLVAEEVEKVCSPLLSRNASSVELPDIVFHVGQEVVKTSDGSLQVQQEVGSLMS
jgi:hypothetical protein